MTAQSMLGLFGYRSGILGSAADLAIAAPITANNLSPLAHTDASRIGFYFDRTIGQERIGFVVMGTQVLQGTINGARTIDGVVGAVAYGFISDAGVNGMYLSGANTLGFSTNSILRLSVSTTAVTSTLEVITPAAVVGGAGLRVPAGTAPAAPVDGALWGTTAGGYYQVNGVTKRLTRIVVALVDGANISVNAAAGDEFTVTLGGNRTIDAPTNPVNGDMILFRLTQDAGAPRTVTWNAIYDFSASLPAPVLSTGVGDVDYVGFIYDSSKVKWHCLAYVLGLG
jgi:hypothetical protein